MSTNLGYRTWPLIVGRIRRTTNSLARIKYQDSVPPSTIWRGSGVEAMVMTQHLNW